MPFRVGEVPHIRSSGTAYRRPLTSNVMPYEEVMSDHVGPEFWERADAVIHLANDQCEAAPRSKVSASLLYAAARFNSFIVASSAANLDELRQDKNEAVKYFTEQYQKMLIENLDDHIANYEKYIGKDA